MTEDNDLGEKYLACQNDNQKVYVLSDAEAVDQLVQNLSSGGKEGLSQKRLWRKLDSGRDDQQKDDMLLEMNTRLQALIGNTAGEQPLSEENLAFENGEQKVYILPDLTAVEQLRRGINKSGEASKSRMWDRATPVADNGQAVVTGLASRLQVVEAKLQRLEGLINSSGTESE